MKILAFSSRNAKEILRDRLNLMFGIGFPVILLLLLSAIQSNIPIPLFEIESLSPGVTVFGLSFVSLFSGMLIAKDRTSSFMLRLFASPMSAGNFIVGYIIPLIPMAILQMAVCFLVSFFLGLPITVNVIFALVVLIPVALLYIAIGLLCGSLFNDTVVSGVCGALLTNLSAWLSGTWFDLKLIGGGFQAAAEVLPFMHAVEAGRSALSGNYADVLPDILWVIGYAVMVMFLAIFVFTSKMKSDNQ